jgi:predicted cupin superfamily sugar epimerase
MSHHPLTAAEAVAALGMEPHPEGGFFKEIFRDAAPDGNRGAITSIYYLLAAGERSHWHTVDAVEIWHYHAGAPLRLYLSHDGQTEESLIIGADIAAGERPQGIVPKGAWQSAESLGAWTLVGCTVAPAFQFEGFRMAPEGWKPGDSLP